MARGRAPHVGRARKFYLFNLPPKASLRRLASAIKARWVCEQAHQQVKEELGLDHIEGRSWTGLHRHALMTMLAYAFLQHRPLVQARRGKKLKAGLPLPQPTLPAVRRGMLDSLEWCIRRCPRCDQILHRTSSS